MPSLVKQNNEFGQAYSAAQSKQGTNQCQRCSRFFWKTGIRTASITSVWLLPAYSRAWSVELHFLCDELWIGQIHVKGHCCESFTQTCTENFKSRTRFSGAADRRKFEQMVRIPSTGRWNFQNTSISWHTAGQSKSKVWPEKAKYGIYSLQRETLWKFRKI